MDGRCTGATLSGERVAGGPVGQAGAHAAARSPGLDGGRLDAPHPHRRRSTQRSRTWRRPRPVRHPRPRPRPGRHHRRAVSRMGPRRPRARPSRLARGRRIPPARRRPANSLPTRSHRARGPMRVFRPRPTLTRKRVGTAPRAPTRRASGSALICASAGAMSSRWSSPSVLSCARPGSARVPPRGRWGLATKRPYIRRIVTHPLSEPASGVLLHADRNGDSFVAFDRPSEGRPGPRRNWWNAAFDKLAALIAG
jgi:hypothetical protein